MLNFFFSFPEDDDSFSLPTPAKENSHNSSFELIGSMIPSYQPCNRQVSRGGNFLLAAGGFRSPSPGFFKTSFISSASKVRFLVLLLSSVNTVTQWLVNKCVFYPDCQIHQKNNTQRWHLAKCFYRRESSGNKLSWSCKCLCTGMDKNGIIKTSVLNHQRKDAVICLFYLK